MNRFIGLFGDEVKNPAPDDVRKFETLLKEHNLNVEIVIYPNVGHAFHADDRQSYRSEAAQKAWTHCVASCKRYLRA